MGKRLGLWLTAIVYLTVIIGCTAPVPVNPGGGPTVPGDTAPPVVKITSPTNNTVVGKAFTVYGTANDPSGISTVYVVAGSGATNSITNLINGSNWSVPVTLAVEGIVAIKAWAKDTNANTSVPVSINVNSDWGTPSVAITAPLNGLLTNVTSVDFSGTANVYIDYNITSVSLDVNGGGYSAAVGTDNWTKSVTLIAGTNSVIARVIADSGKTNFSVPVKVIVDQTGAVVAISSPTNNQMNGKTFLVTGTIQDLSAYGSVYVWVTGQSTNVISSFYNGNYWSNQVVMNTEGVKTINAYATDKWGNAGTPVSVNVQADWGFPSVAILKPTTGILTNVLSLKVSGSASIHTDFNISSVAVKVNGGGYVACSGTTSWSNMSVGLVNGSNNIVARVISDNNRTNFSAAVIVNVDKTPPVVSVTTKQDKNETGLKMFTIRGTITDASGGTMTTYLSLDGAAYMNASMVGGTWSKNYTGVSGSHTVYYYGVDKWGNISATNSTTVDVAKFKWNILVFLNGDNDLETYGVTDFNEMEAFSGLTNYQANIIVLFDRGPGYSTADGNWVGTRLYRITYDAAGVNTTSVSTRLAGTIAGVSLTTSGDSQELNMGSPVVLADFVDYVNNNYEAENEFLIIWDHGDGWRKAENAIASLPQLDKLNKGFFPVTGWGKKSFYSEPSVSPQVKGASTDFSSATNSLLNAEIRVGLTGKGLEVLGFDACLMGTMEAVYEFKDLASVMIASPDLEPGAGWQYNDWLNRFSTAYNITNLYKSVILSFSNQYRLTANTTLAAYDLSKVNALFTDLDSYIGLLLNETNTWINPGRVNFAGSNETYIAGSVEAYTTYAAYDPCHIDIWDLANKHPNASSAALKTAISDAVLMEWHNATGNPNSHGLAIYFGDFSPQPAPIALTTHIFNGYYLIGTNGNFISNSLWNKYLIAHDSVPDYTWKGPGVYGYSATKNAIQIYVTNTGTINTSLAVNASVDDDIYIFYQYLNFSWLVAYSEAGGVGSPETCNFSAPLKGWYIIFINRYSGSAGLSSSVTISQGTGKIY
ncbi:MAG: hypothetical protein A2Y33_04620 [Spirochaetes bacterium GWF1_51_8]|nr:MAG: hypothetical protein A2Y33_04620 [Spirochaetes bacterium GWF1_51_8]